MKGLDCSPSGGCSQKTASASALHVTFLTFPTDIDPRNGIPKLTPGDNPYMFPEQSKEFFKAGATLPPVNFSL